MDVTFTGKTILRHEVMANPQFIYVYGDNLQRTGWGGMAGQMRGLPNTIGVATKRKPDNNESSFYTDQDFAAIGRMIYNDVLNVKKKYESGNYIKIVIPTGIGSGRAKMPTKCPKLYRWLIDCLNRLAWNNLVTLDELDSALWSVIIE